MTLVGRKIGFTIRQIIYDALRWSLETGITFETDKIGTYEKKKNYRPIICSSDRLQLPSPFRKYDIIIRVIYLVQIEMSVVRINEWSIYPPYYLPY